MRRRWWVGGAVLVELPCHHRSGVSILITVSYPWTASRWACTCSTIGRPRWASGWAG